MDIPLPWSAAPLKVTTIVLMTPDCDDSLQHWNLYTHVSLMNDGIKLVEETSSKYAIVGIIHLHYIERQILDSGILNSAKRHLKQYFAHYIDDSPPESIQRCVRELQ
jgi:hypothetical protein